MCEVVPNQENYKSHDAPEERVLQGRNSRRFRFQLEGNVSPGQVGLIRRSGGCGLRKGPPQNACPMGTALVSMATAAAAAVGWLRKAPPPPGSRSQELTPKGERAPFPDSRDRRSCGTN